jgi:outer membrane protein OmpA-like peptidoglycan-associated protein
MRRCLFVWLAFFLAALTPRGALAAPIVITPAQASAAAKSSSGAGACATTVHLSSFNTLTSPGVAAFYVSQAPGMSSVDGKVSLPISAVNFRNADPKAVSDFPNAQPLPFSSLAGSPKAGNDLNIAMRVRGYLNVRSAATYTFGVQADDGYRLSIGGILILQSTVTGASLHDSRQVQFTGPGLYSLELVYFQQTGPGVLALASSPRVDVEVSATPTALPASFKLVDSADLFSALVGQSSCRECQVDADCGANAGQYCRDGLCQGCLVGNHCGASCTACPAALPACSGTQCSECSPEDTHVCDLKGMLCINNACTPCISDAQCATGQICDSAFGQCISRPNIQYSGGCSSVPTRSGPGGGVLITALLVGLFFFVARTRSRAVPAGRRAVTAGRRASVPRLLIPALLIAAVPSAQAQVFSPPLATFNAQTFRPTLGTGNLFTVEGTLLPKPRWPIAGVVFEVANRPLRLVLQDTGETYAATVPTTFTAHLMAGAGITRWFSAALALPVVLYQGFDTRTPTSDVPNTPTVAGLGDLRLLTKFHLVERKGFGLAAVPQLTFPTGSASSFRGDDTFGIEPRLAADYTFRNGVFIAANLGVYIRTYNRTVDFDLVRVSDQLRYGLGVGVPLPRGFAVSAELNGATGFSKFVGGPLYTPLEWYAGARYAIKSSIEVSAGVGGGLVGAVGSPNFRFFAGVAYVIPGTTRARPRPPEPVVRPVVEAPTPESEAPVPASESCADAAAAKDSVRCPDSDHDGVPDKLDACPSQPGTREHSGCPEPVADADKDGVADKLDRCPSEPGPAANGGCPDRDQDKDGVIDRLDKCPKQAGPKESSGCPLLEISETSIRLSLPLKFLPGSAELDTGSRPTVAALVTALRATPTIKKVLIDVTAGGSHHAAKRLATRRAKALSDILVEAGAADELLAIRAVSEPGPDEIARVDLVRDNHLSPATRPEASRPEASKPEASKPEVSKPEASKPEPSRHRSSRADVDESDDDESATSSRRHHRSHRGGDGKSKKSNKEKRSRH